MFLHLPRSSELVEGAFCHPWEDVDHRIQSVLLATSHSDFDQLFAGHLYLVSLCKCYDLQSECEEGTIEKSVHKKHLAWKYMI